MDKEPIPNDTDGITGFTGPAKEDPNRPFKKVWTPPIERIIPKINRNQKCPCGSGRKYKKCCQSRMWMINA